MDENKNILIFGAGGYVGSTLCPLLLENGYRVRAFDNFYKGNCDTLIPLCSDPNFEFIYGDITKTEDVKKAFEGMQVAINLAAIVGYPQCARSPKLSYLVNVDGTANIMNYKGDAKLLFASTGSVYGKVDGLCHENTPMNPQSEYGEHKYLAEKLVRSVKNTISYRFATGFGISPNMRINLLINDLVYQAYTNRCITIFEKNAKRTFIHVRDMANAFLFGIQNFSKMRHNVYNVGSSLNNWSKYDLAEYIKKRMNILVNYAEIGKDKDQRDYEVSYDRIYEEGWHIEMGIPMGIDELIKVAPLIQIRHQYG